LHLDWNAEELAEVPSQLELAHQEVSSVAVAVFPVADQQQKPALGDRLVVGQANAHARRGLVAGHEGVKRCGHVRLGKLDLGHFSGNEILPRRGLSRENKQHREEQKKPG
jgi:hypothetical protein